jgi:hypothetical protein
MVVVHGHPAWPHAAPRAEQVPRAAVPGGGVIAVAAALGLAFVALGGLAWWALGLYLKPTLVLIPTALLVLGARGRGCRPGLRATVLSGAGAAYAWLYFLAMTALPAGGLRSGA